MSWTALVEKKNDIIACYTDGSVTEDGAGAGFIIYNGSQKLKELAITLDKHATIFQAEISAILHASHELLKSDGSIVEIFADSNLAVFALVIWEIKLKLVLDCITALNCLGNDKTCSLDRVPWHCGTKGNESADLQANIGSSRELTSSAPSLPLSYAFIKREIKTYYTDTFNKME